MDNHYIEIPVGGHWSVPEALRSASALDTVVHGRQLLFSTRYYKRQDAEEKDGEGFTYKGQTVLYGRANIMSLFRPAPGYTLAFRPLPGDMPDFRAVLEKIYSMPYDDIYRVTRGRGFYGVDLTDTRNWIPVKHEDDMFIVIYLVLEMLFASVAAAAKEKPRVMSGMYEKKLTEILNCLSANPFVDANSDYVLTAALKAVAEYNNNEDLSGVAPQDVVDRVLEARGKIGFVKATYDVAQIFKQGKEQGWTHVPPYWIDLPALFEMYTLATLREECGDVYFQSGFRMNGTPAEDGEEDLRPDFLVPSEKAVVDAKYSFRAYAEPYDDDVDQIERYAKNAGVRKVLATKEPVRLLVYPSRGGEASEGTVFSRAVDDTLGKGVMCSLLEFPMQKRLGPSE